MTPHTPVLVLVTRDTALATHIHTVHFNKIIWQVCWSAVLRSCVWQCWHMYLYEVSVSDWAAPATDGGSEVPGMWSGHFPYQTPLITPVCRENITSGNKQPKHARWWNLFEEPTFFQHSKFKFPSFTGCKCQYKGHGVTAASLTLIWWCVLMMWYSSHLHDRPPYHFTSAPGISPSVFIYETI